MMEMVDSFFPFVEPSAPNKRTDPRIRIRTLSHTCGTIDIQMIEV